MEHADQPEHIDHLQHTSGFGGSSEAIGRIVEGAGYGGNVALLAKQLSANTISVAHMVSDILDFSTLELGRLELHPSDFALEELIREECRILLPLAQKKGLLLSAEPVQQPVRLRADEGKLGRVLANLIVNAIKYTNEGSVRIGAGLDEAGDVWFCVQDIGIGIPIEDRERIFDEFAQLHDSRGERSKGYGLGLPICRRLITLMGGSISVERASTGGSAFTVHLPSSCVVEAVKPQAPPQKRMIASRRGSDDAQIVEEPDDTSSEYAFLRIVP